MQPFRPPICLRNRHLQTIFATSGPRRLLGRGIWQALRQHARAVILDAGEGAQLAGIHSGHRDRLRDLVTLIHGWEGSANSLYVVSAAGWLSDAGFDVFLRGFRRQSWLDERIAELLTC